MKYEQNVNIKFKQKGKGNVAIRKKRYNIKIV